MRIVRDTLEAPNANRTLVALSQPNTFKLICDAGIAYISENAGAWTPLATGAVLSGWQRTGAAPPAAGLISELNLPDQVAIGAAAPPAAGSMLSVQGTVNPAANDATVRVTALAGQTGDLLRLESSAAAAQFRVTSTGNAAFAGYATSPSITRAVVDGVVQTNVANLAAFTGVSGGTLVDGAVFSQGSRLLLVGQTTATEIGIYDVGVVNAGTAPLTRSFDWSTGSTIKGGSVVAVTPLTLKASPANFQDGGSSSVWLLGFDVLVGTDVPGFEQQSTFFSQYLYSARAVRTTNVANLAAFAVATATDGITLTESDVVLLVAQATSAQNGPYVVGPVVAGFAPLSRPVWFRTGDFVANGFTVNVTEGTVFSATTWKIFATGAFGIVVGTGTPNFYPVEVSGTAALVNGTFTISTVPIFSAKSAVYLSRQAAANSVLTVGGYHPTTGGANGITTGIIGTAAAICEACVAAGTRNVADTSTLHWTVVNQG